MKGCIYPALVVRCGRQNSARIKQLEKIEDFFIKVVTNPELTNKLEEMKEKGLTIDYSSTEKTRGIKDLIAEMKELFSRTV